MMVVVVTCVGNNESSSDTQVMMTAAVMGNDDSSGDTWAMTTAAVACRQLRWQW